MLSFENFRCSKFGEVLPYPTRRHAHFSVRGSAVEILIAFRLPRRIAFLPEYNELANFVTCVILSGIFLFSISVLIWSLLAILKSADVAQLIFSGSASE